MNSVHNNIKKEMKKINKIKLRLTEKSKIKFSSEPSLTIIVANAGLGNAVKRSELEAALLKFSDNILDIVAAPKETFAILFTKDIESSRNIIEKMEEFVILTPDFPKRPIVQAYCLYADTVSEEVIKSSSNFNFDLPIGLEVINNIVNDSDEIQLMEYFSELNKDNGSQMKNRTVLHFGYEFNYNNNRVNINAPLSEKPIPGNCILILSALEKHTGRPYIHFDQLTVNIYRPGDGIPPHVDTHSVFTDEIVSVSLGSPIIMEWRNPDTGYLTNVDLPARSVCIMTGESRYLWQHGIAARKTDLIINERGNNLTRRQRGPRVSLTFRKVKSVANCQCRWPQSCDIERQQTPEMSLSLENPSQLEGEFVHKVYEEIADHFSSTRHSMWPNVRRFIDEQKPGSIGADIGCGNGKYFPAIQGRGFLLGSDMSNNLCKIASDAHKIDVVQSNCLQLPYRASCADYFISIAVLHHLSTVERRQKSVERMVKMLRHGGNGLIYVWAKEQKKTGVSSHYVSGRNHHDQRTQSQTVTEVTSEAPLPVHVNRTEFSSTDMLVPWSKKTGNKSAEVFTRYYHLFVEGELESLCLSVSHVVVVQSWYDSGNWAVVIEKI